MALFYGTSGVAQTVAGFMVDRFGARVVLLLGFVLLCGSSIAYGFAEGYWMLVPLVMLAGLGNSVFHPRSEEHTSELQSLMRISYAVFCLKKKKYKSHNT